MGSHDRESRVAFMSCVEVVLMRRGNTNYHAVMAKLQSHYDSWIYECLDHPEYLRDVLKQVYRDDYDSVITEIRLESEILDDIYEIKNDFFKAMTS